MRELREHVSKKLERHLNKNININGETMVLTSFTWIDRHHLKINDKIIYVDNIEFIFGDIYIDSIDKEIIISF